MTNLWTAGPERGGLPKVPSRAALPTASADFAYALVVVEGTPDELYICLRDSLGAWEWVMIATGTP